jgi:hypothetical protein
MTRSLPQPSLLLGESLGGGEMAAHDTGIVSHSAAVPPTDVAMGTLNIIYHFLFQIYHFLFQERRFVGYTALLCAAASELVFPLSHWERAGVREAHPLDHILPPSPERKGDRRSAAKSCNVRPVGL